MVIKVWFLKQFQQLSGPVSFIRVKDRTWVILIFLCTTSTISRVCLKDSKPCMPSLRLSTRPQFPSTYCALLCDVFHVLHTNKDLLPFRPHLSLLPDLSGDCHPSVQCQAFSLNEGSMGESQSLSHVRLCVTPQTAAHQAPPSLGFSRQEHWSGLPLPSPHIWLVYW